MRKFRAYAADSNDDMSLAAVPSRHRRAVLMMIAGAACWSTGGLLVRSLSITNAWEIVFWRSLFMSAFVALVLTVLHGRAMPRQVRAVGVPGLVAGALLAGTFFFFIGSITRTTVANTFVLMSVSPFLAAIAARLVLHEPVPARTWLAILIALAGILVMFGGTADADSSPATSWHSAYPCASPRSSPCCASSTRRSTCCRW